MIEYIRSVAHFSARVIFRAGRRGRLRSQNRRVCLLVTLLSVFFIANASGSVRHIWACNDGEKIARDEIIAFQLIIEADKDGVNSLRVTLPQLAQKGGKGRISYAAPVTDPTNYVGRPIQLFSVNYL